MRGSRYKLEYQNGKYVIIDKYPYEVIIEEFYEDEYDIAKETFDIYIDEEKK